MSIKDKQPTKDALASPPAGSESTSSTKLSPSEQRPQEESTQRNQIVRRHEKFFLQWSDVRFSLLAKA